MEILFKKPIREEYSEIVQFVNEADEIFKTIVTFPEELEYIASETVSGLIEGEKNKKYLCAYIQGKPVGFVLYYFKNEYVLWVSMLFVNKKFQKFGIGSRILAEIEKIGKENFLKVIALETPVKANWSVGFYKKNNYTIMSDEDMKNFPFNHILNKPQVPGRYIFVKEL